MSAITLHKHEEVMANQANVTIPVALGVIVSEIQLKQKSFEYGDGELKVRFEPCGDKWVAINVPMSVAENYGRMEAAEVFKAQDILVDFESGKIKTGKGINKNAKSAPSVEASIVPEDDPGPFLVISGTAQSEDVLKELDKAGAEVAEVDGRGVIQNVPGELVERIKGRIAKVPQADGLALLDVGIKLAEAKPEPDPKAPAKPKTAAKK